MSEFDLIDKYFANLGVKHPDTLLSVGDDAAIVNVPDGFELVISMDSMVEGIHFLEGLSPELLAHKIMAVNLSDMAAMGATPKWATLANTMPDYDQKWVTQFSSTLNAVANKYGVQIVGGDTTEGPRNISITIMGLLPKGQSLLRSGAQVGDTLYCTGEIGDAALALSHLLGEQTLNDDIYEATLPALHLPQPQVNLGQQLLGVASSCIDMSDGLVGDAAHIAKLSNVTLEIETNSLPLSKAYQRYLSDGGLMQYAVSGGDDYQLLFTANNTKKALLASIEKDVDVKITAIGRVTSAGTNSVVTLVDGEQNTIKPTPYQHFER